jgi:hypothetical protein
MVEHGEHLANYRFSIELRKAIGDSGIILTWSSFEDSTLHGIEAELAEFDKADDDLTNWITTTVSPRGMVDLCDSCAKYFYHPAMRGRTSIKVVTDALWKSDETMRSQSSNGLASMPMRNGIHILSLPAVEINGIQQDVREGTGAMRAYEAMTYGVERHNGHAKGLWAVLLKQYCKLDTLSRSSSLSIGVA